MCTYIPYGLNGVCVDAPCSTGGVMVLVTGSMTKKGMTTSRRFVQSFFLARQNVGTNLPNTFHHTHIRHLVPFHIRSRSLCWCHKALQIGLTGT